MVSGDGDRHTAGVTKGCGAGATDIWQLGHGHRQTIQRPKRLGREIFCGLPAAMVACSFERMLVLTVVGRAATDAMTD